MFVYRLSQTMYARDLSGEGARLFGGRWNVPMVGCLYTSESRALALLEYSANTETYQILRALSFVKIEIDDKKIKAVKIADLPGNWRDSPAPEETREFGTVLLRKQKIMIVKIPSVIIPGEFNYLINPLYYKDAKLIETTDYSYDLRVKK